MTSSQLANASTMDERIRASRVLMVGAGGIGCELLKDLVMAGFGTIEIVDLDTIDLSNLNRQFLFRHEHIKRPKALVAQESASKFNCEVNVISHHANIKDPQFGVGWFSTFDVIFNALDNLEARRHVNQMALATKVPLIDCGTAGYEGQVQVIWPGVTECYDCNPKATPKTFPVCTIRSTPSKPIHCIVWAKSFLFTEVFGTVETGSSHSEDIDHEEDEANAKEISELKRETEELQEIRNSVGSPDFARLVFTKVFSTDIMRLRNMEDMWKDRQAPIPLDYDTLVHSRPSIPPEAISRRDRSVWSLEETFAVFEDSVARLSCRLLALRREDGVSECASDAILASSESARENILEFDKDDIDTLDFVATCANLRSHVFGIAPQSKFEIKQMAGNIIPAIATTNAIVSGLGVLQALKVLEQKFDKARSLFLCRVGNFGRMFSAQLLCPKHEDCASCGQSVYVRVSVDLNTATVEQLVHAIRTDLNYTSPSEFEEAEFSIATSGMNIIYDPDLDDNLPRRLEDVGVKHGDFLTVVDDADENPFMNVVLALCPPSSGGDINRDQVNSDSRDSSVRILDRIAIPRQPPKPVEEPSLRPEASTKTVSLGNDREIVLDEELDFERQGEGDPNSKQQGRLEPATSATGVNSTPELDRPSFILGRKRRLSEISHDQDWSNNNNNISVHGLERGSNSALSIDPSRIDQMEVASSTISPDETEHLDCFRDPKKRKRMKEVDENMEGDAQLDMQDYSEENLRRAADFKDGTRDAVRLDDDEADEAAVDHGVVLLDSSSSDNNEAVESADHQRNRGSPPSTGQMSDVDVICLD